jgi:hypothetical protein
MKHIAIAILSGALLIHPALAACLPDGRDCANAWVNTWVPHPGPTLQDIGSPTWSPATKEDIDNLNKRLDQIEKLIRVMSEEHR